MLSLLYVAHHSTFLEHASEKTTGKVQTQILNDLYPSPLYCHHECCPLKQQILFLFFRIIKSVDELRLYGLPILLLLTLLLSQAWIISNFIATNAFRFPVLADAMTWNIECKLTINFVYHEMTDNWLLGQGNSNTVRIQKKAQMTVQ
jgi:hypothetical protein